MTSSFRVLYALLSLLLAVAQAAPPRGIKHVPHLPWSKRQTEQLLLTETRTEVFSETLTETFTETFTASESGITGTSSSTESTLTGTATTVTTSAFHLPSQGVHVEGDVPNQDPSAQDVFFLPLGSQDSSLGSPTSTVPVSADASSSSVPTPTDTLANATVTDSGYSGDAGPAFAAQTPVVKGPLLSAYYPDWAASVLPPESIDMTRLDWIDFAFGVLNQDCSIGFDDPSSSPGILNRVVSAAHAKSVKVKLSIGGWDGSRYFSACSTSNSRNTFVNNVVNVYNQYHLDGIDIDWEYPGQQGEGQNGVSSQDSANFLATLKLMRSKLPSGARITAAVQDTPFVGPNGNPMSDVSGFAAVLDWVNIMNYDVFSSSSNPGPNAPLDNGCNDSSQPQYNARSAISAWSNAKFPASRLMLGVPFYGYLNPSDATQLQHKKRSLVRRQDSSSSDTQIETDSTATTTSAMPMLSILPVISIPVPVPFPVPSVADNVTDTASNITAPPASKSAQGPAGTVVLQSSDGTTSGGQIQFLSIVQQDALQSVRAVNGSIVAPSTTFVGAGGFTRFWDSCSSTPFLSSQYANQVVTYDDTESLGLKASFAKQAQILGTAVWDLSGDTRQWDLLNALRRGLGKQV